MNNSNDVVTRLDALIRLTEMRNRLAAISACGDQTQKAKIALLGTVGFTAREIADLLGTTRNTVSVALSGLRKGRKVRGRKSAAEDAEE